MADLTITGTILGAPGATGYSKSQLLELARWYIDTLGVDYVQDSNALAWDLGQCLDLAYMEYARQTRCFPVILTASTVADQAAYDYADFGSGAGARVFDIDVLLSSGQQTPLTRVTVTEMERHSQVWRNAESGNPTAWLPWGERGIRLYRPPSSVLTLTLEGWETPDLSLFTSDASPNIHQADQPLLAIYAALLAATRNPNDENAMRQNRLYPEWQSGIARASARISGAGREVVVFGKYASDGIDTRNYTLGTTITNL